MLNKSGPSTEPCGTPAIIFSQRTKTVINTNPLLPIVSNP